MVSDERFEKRHGRRCAKGLVATQIDRRETRHVGRDSSRTSQADNSAGRQKPHPTLPSRLIEISFCASTANSIGSCCSTSLTKPLTTSATASSSLNPRCMQ
jgi:hypothetical protein